MSLEDELTWALEGTIKAAKAHGFIPRIFIRMLARFGGVGTAKRLLAVERLQAGLIQLCELGLLHESMEAVVLQPKFQPLFTEEELTEARKRLEELGFFKDTT